MRLYSVGQLSNSEKSDILSKHSSVYNGYRTMQPKVSNQQPLYVQDFANDKNGITVNGSGEVSSYNNKIYMKEQWEALAADAIASELGAAEMAPAIELGLNSSSGFIDDFRSPTSSHYNDGEVDEISVHDLKKGKKYKYKSPSFEDDIEFEDEIDYPQGEKHFSFKGDKSRSHLMGDKHIEDFVSHMDDTDEGIYDVEDINPRNKFDYTDESEMDEDHIELYEPMESAFADELDEVTGPSPLYSEVDFPAYNFKSEGPNFAPHGVKEDEMNEQYFEDQFDNEPEEHEVEDLGYATHGGEFDMDDSDDDKSDKESVFKRMRRGAGDVEDIDWEDLTEGLSEDIKGTIMGFLKPRKKESDRRPYTAEAVEHIIKLIKNVKTEEHLESVMNMVDNLYTSNDDVNDAYKERITRAYKRKADELGHYLKKKDYDFDEVDEDLQESFLIQKNKINEMFNRMNKYN
jgi:hypothetical protein